MAHDHAHCHTPTNFNRAFAIGTILNLFFVVVEAGYGAISNSLALIADAGHNLKRRYDPAPRLGRDGAGKSFGDGQAHLRL